MDETAPQIAPGASIAAKISLKSKFFELIVLLLCGRVLGEWGGAGVGGDVDRVGGLSFLQRVVEGDDLGSHGGEDLSEHCCELLVRRVVGPQGEDSAGAQQPAQMVQAGRLVEVGIAGVQQVAG